MTDFLKQNIGRRAVLGAGLAGASMLTMPSILRAQEKSLKVGVYGGYLKD
jgi:putative spermidine/putrescine transport system substrate-binding protein